MSIIFSDNYYISKIITKIFVTYKIKYELLPENILTYKNV